MRNTWVVVVMLGLGSWSSAWAQDAAARQHSLLDEASVPEGLNFEDGQDKKQETEFPVYGGKLEDERPVGPYRRPMWTMHRVSPTTRIYLQVDPGEVEFEQWLDFRIRKNRQNPDDRIRLSEEFEFGLGNRFQLDLYANSIWARNNGKDASLAIRSWAAEVRYALADWGVIWGNPTLYLEYILWNNQNNGHGDEATASIEPKILLGGEIATGWHWGFNAFYEHTFNAEVTEVGVTGSVLHTVIDGLLTIGLTGKYVYTAEAGDPLTPGGQSKAYSNEVYVGPSFQIRMATIDTEMESGGQKVKVKKAKAHLDIEPLFGLTKPSDRMQLLFVFGWDF